MVSARQVLRYPAVRRYLVSTVLSALSVNILVTVLFKQTFDISGDELDIGFIGLAQFVPAVLLVLVSGWVADRFDRRRVTALFLFGRAACAGGLVLYSVIEPGTLWPLFLIAFVFGTADAMANPPRRAIPPLIATTAEFPQVVALWTATFTGASIAGPVLGGFLYSVGAAEAYGLAALLEFAAIFPLLAITYSRPQERLTERPTIRSAMEGLHFIRRTPVVLAAISLDLFAVLFGGAMALIPAVASERLGVGDIAYGWLRAAPGVGAALMAVWLAVRPVRRRVGPTLLTAVAVFGLGSIVFGVTRSYMVAFLSLVVIAAADMVSMYVRSSLVPLVTPSDQLGRVSAVEGVFIGASNELGAFESGLTARVFGLPWAIAGGGFLTILVAASFAWLFPSVRRIDTFDELDPARAPAATGP